MRSKFAVCGLLCFALLTAGVALADAMADVSIQYEGDAIGVRNDGAEGVSARVMRMCAAGETPLRLRPPQIRYFKVTVQPGTTARIDRDRGDSCSYSIAAAHYVR